MQLKIIGAGFGRTGTRSTCKALNHLGYPCYHMFEVLNKRKNKSHINFWLRVAGAPAQTQHNWGEVFESYAATLDHPAAVVWKELFAKYPDAKVILTLHPKGPEVWYDSVNTTIYSLQKMWQFKIIQLISPLARKFHAMSQLLIWQRFHKDTFPNKEAAVKNYKAHIQEVKSCIPPEQLLIFSADQGWKPLCKFLSKEVPDIAFPRVNDRAKMKRLILFFHFAAYALILSSVLLLSVLLYLLINWS